MDKQSVLGNNDIDDVRWLCSLTESELDLLVGLKNLVHLRAKKIGHEDLTEKFDLKMLRTLSFYFMENLEGRLKDLLGPTGFLRTCLQIKSRRPGTEGSLRLRRVVTPN
ncbi:uncharacterized protein LOC142543141 isoform X3 [Primulina tabacum]|uniref:uncharacterized protein LOC142543141 isoform X3 n=1 Tax=Primulina tabacum TaxID=48773 RepID=UPI003F5A54BF